MKTSFIILIAVATAVALAVFLLRRQAMYYGRIFSDEHYTEVGNWLLEMLKQGQVEGPDVQSGTGFHSSAGCAFSYSRDIDGDDEIHIAISQIGRHTTHAVCSRFAFLFLQILKQNKARANFLFTESHVHHFVFSKPVADDGSSDWLVRDITQALADMSLYRAIDFEFVPMQSIPVA